MDVIKLFIAFGLGVVAGAVGGKLYFEQKAEDRADAEIDDVKRHYLEKSISDRESLLAKQPAKPDEFDADKIVARIDKNLRENGKIVAQIGEELREKKSNLLNQIKTNYSDISKKEEDKKLKTEHPEEDMPMEPYEITETEFSNEKFDYDKISLTIYDEDEALVDESEELLEADGTIGSDLFDKFLADEMDIMYVRNNATSTDYEVKLVYGSYHDTLGI